METEKFQAWLIEVISLTQKYEFDIIPMPEQSGKNFVIIEIWKKGNWSEKSP